MDYQEFQNLKWIIKNNLTNGIEKNPQTCLLALNNMLLNMDLFHDNPVIKVKTNNFYDMVNEKSVDYILNILNI